MKIDKVKLRCKKGHGITDHGIYKYGNSTVFACFECTKERKRRRRKNPEKREMDAAYTKKWYRNNIEKVRESNKAREKRKKDQRDAEVLEFLNTRRISIKRYLSALQSDYTWADIKKHCLRMHVTSLPKVKQYIRSHKLSQLKNAEVYKASTLIKYNYGVQNNWGELPEEVKEKIRKEYKSKGKKEATQKLKVLESRY